MQEAVFRLRSISEFHSEPLRIEAELWTVYEQVELAAVHLATWGREVRFEGFYSPETGRGMAAGASSGVSGWIAAASLEEMLGKYVAAVRRAPPQFSGRPRARPSSSGRRRPQSRAML
jgi:hypothetical protein